MSSPARRTIGQRFYWHTWRLWCAFGLHRWQTNVGRVDPWDEACWCGGCGKERV